MEGSDVRSQVTLLERLHKEDYLSSAEGSSHKPLRQHLKSLSELALQGPNVASALASKTRLAEEMEAIIESHSSLSVVGDALALVCDFMEFDQEAQGREAFLALVNRFLDVNIPREVVKILGRQDASELHADCLRFLSDLCEIYPTAGPEHLVERTEVVSILIDLSTAKLGGKNATAVDVAEASTAGEVLSTILDASDAARRRVSSQPELLDKLLRGVANWKSHEPGFAEEEEWREVLHSCLRRSIEDSSTGRANFRQSEGVELLVKMLSARVGDSSTWRRKRAAGDESTVDGLTLALELLKVALDNDSESCRRFVDASGLKYVFPIWMKLSTSSSAVKRSKPWMEDDDEPPIGSAKLAFEVIARLVLWLDEADVQLQRIRAKFGQESEKLDRLVSHFVVYTRLVQTRMDELAEEEEEEEEEDEEAARIREEMDLMDHGLKELQLVNVILCRWMKKRADDDDGLPDRVKAALKRALGVEEGDDSAVIVEEVRQVVADMAESCVVLADDGEIDEAATAAMKARLVGIALF